MNPKGCGVDYRNFLSTMQGTKRNFDSNISNTIEHNRRVLAYKYKEQGLRSAALKVNVEHDTVQQFALKAVVLKQTVDQQALTQTKTKLIHEHPNYSRSSHHYVSQPTLVINF
jgi:hypothetical protein